MKPFSEACEQNKQPILDVLREWFVQASDVLEIGSGTGQHAAWFASQLPYLTWHTSDLVSNHAGIRQWLADSNLDNVRPPLALDVRDPPRLSASYTYIFSANTLHIMAWPSVGDFFRLAGNVLNNDGLLVVYGPFNYNGQYTSESNARFDTWLKQRDPDSGIRDIEALDELANGNGLLRIADIEMPVNNRILIWKKAPAFPG